MQFCGRSRGALAAITRTPLTSALVPHRWSTTYCGFAPDYSWKVRFFMSENSIPAPRGNGSGESISNDQDNVTQLHANPTHEVSGDIMRGAAMNRRWRTLTPT
jgi:hypothetical protein